MGDLISSGTSVDKRSKELTILEECVINIEALSASPLHNAAGKPDTTSPSRFSDHLENEKCYLKRESNLVLVKESFLQEFFRDMANSVSLPGSKFIGKQSQPAFHTYFWIFVHCIALHFSFSHIIAEYYNYQTPYLLRTKINNLTLVSEVPFPAITICLPDSIHDGYDYAGSLEKCFLCNTTEDDKCTYNEMCTFEETASIAIASLMCLSGNYNRISDIPWFVFEQSNQSPLSSKEFSNFAENLVPQCDISVSQERYTKDNKFVNVHYHESGCYGNGYQHFMSNRGICFTINGLKHEDMYKEHTILSLPVKPGSEFRENYVGKEFRTNLYSAGNLDGSVRTVPAAVTKDHIIKIAISDRQNEINTAFCRPDKQSLSTFSFIIHSPTEIPVLYENDFVLETGEAKEILVTPELLFTDWGPAMDACVDWDQRELAMFKEYSENNCDQECIANCSLEHCGCVPYYLPRHNTSVKVCFSTCILEIPCDCGCLPDCTSLSYSIEVINKKGNSSDLGLLYIKYKTKGFHASLRTGKTTFLQFVAYSLGILGVFNGFSFMVAAELFYFLSFKLWHSVKTYFKYNNRTS